MDRRPRLKPTARYRKPVPGHAARCHDRRDRDESGHAAKNATDVGRPLVRIAALRTVW
jgi:hypothetical protein